MFNRGFGAVRGMGIPGSAGEFEQMARQYWNAWEQALRGGVPGGAPMQQPGGQAWQEALQCWSDVFAHKPVTNDVTARFGQQAQQWYAQIQQLAAQFGGQGGSPADITQAWKAALGNAGINPFQHLLDSMNGPNMQGMEQWLRGVQPVLDMLTGGGQSWIKTPAFGFTREHQQRLQALAAAQVEVQQANKAYQEVLMHASQAAFQRFEQRLSACVAEGRSIDTPRALFDQWVEAAEQAYAELALSAQYRTAYGNLLNAQIRLRAGIQAEIEQFCAQLGMPTRTEVDGAHRKIVELERELRRMRERSERAVNAVAEPAPVVERPKTPVAGQPKARKAAVKPPATTARKPASKTAAKTASKTAAKPATKPANKKAPARKVSTSTINR